MASTEVEKGGKGSHPGIGKYEGVVEHRHTTDPLCFLLIIAVWVVMTIIGGMQDTHTV